MGAATDRFSCCAILTVRNEEFHVRRSLLELVSQGIDVVVIDHDSTDRTRQLCEEFIGHGLLEIARLPWEGAFDLSAQLEAKEAVIGRLTHDWVIHADADEILQSPVEGESLLEGITRADRSGHTAVNFDEFVFLPLSAAEPDPTSYVETSLHYYFYEPRANRLMRAWKRGSGRTNVRSGGHVLEGGVRLFPESFILRHYIVQSQAHAIEKYCGRGFSRADVAKGWHARRIGIAPERMRLPSPHDLMRLEHGQSRQFDRSRPRLTHFWEW